MTKDSAKLTPTRINHMIGEAMVDGGDYLMRFARALESEAYKQGQGDRSKEIGEWLDAKWYDVAPNYEEFHLRVMLEIEPLKRGEGLPIEGGGE